jgi:hypothetical protein
MAVIRVGSQTGSSLVAYPSQPSKTRDANGNWTLVYKYWCLRTSAESLLPANGDAPPGGVHSTLELSQAQVTPQLQNPEIVDVELTYTAPNRGYAFPVKPGEIRFEADTTVADANIIQKLIANGASEAEKNEVLNDLHKKTYLAPVPIFRRIENKSSFTWSEANIIADVGLRSTPTGMTSPTAGKWLKTRLSVQQQGTRAIVTEEWAYSTNAWDGAEYDT